MLLTVILLADLARGAFETDGYYKFFSANGQIVEDDTSNLPPIVNGSSLAPDPEDSKFTDRRAYMIPGQRLTLAPPEISQTGYSLPSSFCLHTWIYPLYTTSSTLVQKGSKLEYGINTGDLVWSLYNGQTGSSVSTALTSNLYIDKWGILSISHVESSSFSTLQVFYNNNHGSVLLIINPWTDSSSNLLILGSTFKGFLYYLKIFRGCLLYTSPSPRDS